ncbi:MAG TPA: MCE family protein [Acidimicrobiales bacterium]
MLTRRVVANLVIFAVLGVALAAWAATNVVQIGALSHPYAISADFPSSPGLRPDFEVAYLGVKVGRVVSVRLAPGEAVVHLDIDRGVHLPVGLQAAASRQSPVGEPYVALSPPPGYVNGGPYVTAGYVIPLARTSAPLSYEDVFASLDRLAAAVPPQALAVLLHELAAGLDGRAGTIRDLLANTDALTASLATNAPQIDQLIGDLTQLTHTLADHRDALGSGLDNLAAVTAGLAQSRQAIDTLLTTAPGFAAEVDTILAQSTGNLGCLLDGLGTVAGVLGDPRHIAALEQVLAVAPRLVGDIPAIESQTSSGPMLYGTGSFNLSGAPLPVYPTPRQLPAAKTAPPCAAAITPPGAVGPVSSGAGGRAGPHAGPGTVPAGVPPGAMTLERPSSTKPIGGRSWPVWVIVALAVLLLLLALTRPWRLISRGRQGVR